MNLSNVSINDLNRAIKIKEQIEELQSELDRLLGESSTPAATRKGKNKMSAAGRAAIAEAQRLRWAKIKGSGATKVAKKGRRKMSAAGRARIAAAARARWAKFRAEKRS